MSWGGLFGSIIGNASQGRREDKQWGNFKRQEEVNRDNYAKSIQIRVADAQKAGVHPLFALGASVQQNPGQYVGPSPNTGFGEGIGKALDELLTGERQETHKAALDESRARTELLEAQKEDVVARMALDSEIARGRQNSNVQQDAIKLNPDKYIVSRGDDKSVGAAPSQPGFKEYTVGSHGLSILLPQSDEGMGESLENISWWQWPVVVSMNVARYGENWLTRLYKEVILNQAPTYRRGNDKDRLESIEEFIKREFPKKPSF